MNIHRGVKQNENFGVFIICKKKQLCQLPLPRYSMCESVYKTSTNDSLSMGNLGIQGDNIFLQGQRLLWQLCN